MMSYDFVLLGVVKGTDSYKEGRKTNIPPQNKKKLLASSLSRHSSLSSLEYLPITYIGVW